MVLVVSILILLSLVTTGIYSVYGLSSDASTFPIGSKPFGVPYEDWVERWWQWNYQIPKAQHPISANLTECPVGESGSVSFLTQALQGKPQYSCTIPSNHAILIPIGNGLCTNDEAKSSEPAAMMTCATEGNKFLKYKASIDGIPLNGLDQIEVKTKVFNITIPVDNFAGSEVNHGQWIAVAGGYYIFLKPVTPGDHKLSINAEVLNTLKPRYNFNYDAQFLLKVK